MKNLLKFILIDIILFSVFAFIVTSVTLEEKCGTSLPTYPHTFQGYADYGGSVLTTQTVTATLDGVEWSTTTDSDGFYNIKVARCGNSSATAITFTVCTRTASETATFSENAVNTSANLTISSACPTTTTTTTSGGGGGGGGGGAGGGGVAVPSETNLDAKPTFTTVGHTIKQTQGDTATFTIKGKKYTAKLTKLKADSVTITINGQSKLLKIGETAEFDVDGDGVNDISVTLAGIEGGRAQVVYKALFETGMMALLNTIRAFYSGTSNLTMMELLDKIRAFYGG